MMIPIQRPLQPPARRSHQRLSRLQRRQIHHRPVPQTRHQRCTTHHHRRTIGTNALPNVGDDVREWYCDAVDVPIGE